VAAFAAAVPVLTALGLVTGVVAVHASAGLVATVGPSGMVDVSDGAIDIVFDPAQEGGISQVYELSTDPGRTVNIGPAPGYTLFDMYVNDAHDWGEIGHGTASVLQVVRSSPDSVVVHAIGAFQHEDGSGPVSGLQHETWTTIYPGGRLFILRHMIVGANPVTLYNIGGKALDVSSATTWHAIFDGAASDTSFPSGTNTSAGNGSESWLGFWQAGSGPGQNLSTGVTSWQGNEYGLTYKDVRILVGSVSVRSHEAQRVEGTVILAANTTYSSQFSGWLSSQVRIGSMSAVVADYQNPAISVASGVLAGSDSEPVATALTKGYNPATGSYVLAASATGVLVQLQFPAGVTTRFRPAFKVTGWPTGSSPQVQLGAGVLSSGSDYLADYDATSGALRLVFLRDIVPATPQSGQLLNDVISVTPAGVSPAPSPAASPSSSPSPSASPSPTPAVSPSPSPTPGGAVPGQLNVILGSDTIEVNDGTTFAAIFDRNQAGGISRLYDLATDPKRTSNLGPQPGYSVFNSYLLDQQVYAPTTTNGVWGELGEGPATTFEVLNASPESATVHTVSPYYCEQVDAPGGICFLTDVTAETWTTIYPGGHVFFERHIITGSTAHQLANAAPASVDLCLCSGLYGIFDGAPSDTSFPSPDDVHAGNGTERWWGQYQTGTGPGHSLGVLEVAYQNNSYGLSYADMRLIIGSAYLRSHITPRTEDLTDPVLAANTVYVARYRGWLSSLVNSANANAMTADYRSPSLTVTAGTVLTSDAELNSSGLVSGYNPGTGRYVVAEDSTGVFEGQLGFPGGVTIRYRPSVKLVGWGGGPVVVRWGGSVLTAGTDYLTSVDSSGNLRVTLEFDVVTGSPGSGQRQTATLRVSAS